MIMRVSLVYLIVSPTQESLRIVSRTEETFVASQETAVTSTDKTIYYIDGKQKHIEMIQSHELMRYNTKWIMDGKSSNNRCLAITTDEHSM